ncbi:unnamed protein product [Calypogeia fissa]
MNPRGRGGGVGVGAGGPSPKPFKAKWNGTAVDEESNGTEFSISFRASNTCGLNVSKDAEIIEGVLGTLVKGPILKLARVLGAFRHFVACARPRIHRSPSVDESHVMLSKQLSITEGRRNQQQDGEFGRNGNNGFGNGFGSKDGGKEGGNVGQQMRMRNLECMKVELLAVLRHLEVRWQLFNEAMTKWCDLESMLAICTDNVTWSGGSGAVITGKDSPQLSENLRSLLNKRLSFHVVIERVTRLSPKVFPDMSLDKDGNCIELEDSEVRNAAATLDKLLGSRKNTVYNDEDGWYKDRGPYMVLEEDWYTLQDDWGRVVEEGTRTVLWKQHNSTWYIRACIVKPSSEKSSIS